jgi:hypothetical protein
VTGESTSGWSIHVVRVVQCHYCEFRCTRHGDDARRARMCAYVHAATCSKRGDHHDEEIENLLAWKRGEWS